MNPLMISPRPKLCIAALSAAVFFGGAAVADNEVVYRETFPVEKDGAVKLTEVGWRAWLYSTKNQKMHREADSYTELVRGQPSRPADAEPVNAQALSDDPIGTGMLVNWNGGTLWPNPTLYFTEELILDDVGRLASVSWFQNNQGSTGGFRLAVRVNRNWLVSSDNYIGFKTVRIRAADTKWYPLDPTRLSFDPDTEPVDLSEGTLTAIGVFGNHTGYAELDTFTVRADVGQEPE